ncbi:M24 family metallopeptidase [Alicyclobacillus sp. SO9]|uniref:M24 family metallopeptidase n=1 Tax=Alicyclobacillus sp. SO9 TaxID=2665646 RepID=UPI0018E8D51A|nr:M24 family metallopeptidase [Alicyclobacillus sp. SO9]QQE79006.1 M24 family metallopeptidase [Alicyclobacillus sp. SO9]
MSLFTVPEYESRLRKTKLLMEQRGIDVLLVTDPANMNYLTGYDGWSFYVHQMVAVFAEDAEPFWIGRKQDANGAKLTTWLDHRNILPYPEDYVQSDEHHPMDFVVDLLHQRRKAHASIGVEKDAYYFTAACSETLQQGLPDATFINATLLVNRVRIVKSPEEIGLMKNAARLVQKAMTIATQSIEVGARECDVAAKVYHAQIAGLEDIGGDYPAIVPLMPSGRKTSCSHLTWTDERYRDGDTVILELAGCYKRYHSPLARTLTLGKAPQAVQDLADVVVEGLEQAISAVKPGVTCADIDQVWRNVIEPRGYSKDSRLGYSVGMNYPPDWGEHTASIRKGDRTVLRPNMTFHMIAGMWTDDYGVEISETFCVTENGAQVLAAVPRRLFQNL